MESDRASLAGACHGLAAPNLEAPAVDHVDRFDANDQGVVGCGDEFGKLDMVRNCGGQRSDEE